MTAAASSRVQYVVTRIAQIAPQRRPQYGPYERMAILELRAARSWSLKQTADAFFLTSATVTSWMKRINEKGPDALLQLREPVNIHTAPRGIAAPAVGQAVGNVTDSLTLLTATWYECSVAR